MPMSMMRAQRGMTLSEVMIASVVAFVVVIGIGAVDVTRFRIEEDIRQRAALVSPEHEEAARATILITKGFERADRINRLGASSIQVRIPESDFDCPVAPTADCTAVCTGCTGALPPSCCLEIAKNYRWDQYRLSGTNLEVYRDRAATAACPAAQVLARQISSLSFDYLHVAAAPPGGEALDLDGDGVKEPEDNNLMTYALTLANGGRTHTFRGSVTIRDGVYSDLNTSPAGRLGDSGSGLAAAGVDDVPPGSCP